MNIKDNSIIICENTYKESLLKKFSQNKLFLNVKFYTKESFFEEYYFKYKDETLSYLINKYGYKVDIAKMYLNNLYYIDKNNTYFDERLQRLVDLKIDLKEHDFLLYNSFFKDYLKDKNIYVLGYSYLDNLEKNVFDNYKTFYEEFSDEYHHDNLLFFDNIEDEINYVLKEICKLIEQGIDIKKIKLVNVPKDYYDTLDRLCYFYNIPLKSLYKRSLYSLRITSDFLDNYDSDITKSIESIKKYDAKLVNKIITICNKYSYIDDYLKVKPLIIDDLKKTNVNEEEIQNALEVVDTNYPFDQDDYVFLLNFAIGSIPAYVKDEKYITDSIKNEVHLKSTNEINQNIKEYTLKKIKSIKNLRISYSKKVNGMECYPSSLVSELGLNIIKEKDDILDSYSTLYSKINYARCLDLFYKYGEIDSNLGIYQNSLDINYHCFDNQFKGINQEELLKVLNNKLTLSYSSFDIYNKCAFRYYLNNVLKLEEYSQNFEAFIGSIFHDVLSKCFSEKLDVQEEITKYIKENNKELTVKEEFFIQKIIKDIEFVIDTLNKQKENIGLDKNLFEQKIVIDKTKDIPISFMGYVDKILYKEYEKQTLLAIIDYKTGTVDVDLKYLPYGFGMQLPIYLYLVKKANLFTNPVFVGFYLEYILDKNINIDPKKSYLEQKENNLKLMGYSLSDSDLLEKFDLTYANSQVISGMKTKNDGNFYYYAKVLNNKQMDKIIEIVEAKIDEAIEHILKGKFDINPKKIGYSKDIGCKYCKFKDICNKTEDDYIIYDEIEDLSFLGGGEDA